MKEIILVKSDLIITPTQQIRKGAVLIKDNKIFWVGTQRCLPTIINAKVVDLGEMTIAPGFMDIHFHGYGGKTIYSSSDDLRTISSSLLKYGVTSFLPTIADLGCMELILTKLNEIKEVMDTEIGAQIVGTHMEGPFLSKEESAVGAQNLKYIRPPSLVELNKMYEASDGTIRYMTIAPELDGALETICEMNRLGIVPSAGHSMATYEEIIRAIEFGLKSVCHTYNGMPQLHHRGVGLVGAALLRPELNSELIGDGQHVGKEAMQLLYYCKGVSGIIIVTDNSQFTGLPVGRYEDANGFLRIKTECNCTNAEGRLAGSVMPMNYMVKTVSKLTGCTLAQAVQMASLNPARLIGFGNSKGSIEKGKDADLIAFDTELTVKWVMVRGRIVKMTN